MTSEVPNPGLTTNSQLNHLVKDAQAIGMELKGLASFASHTKKKKQWTCILFSHKEHGNQAIHRREARTDSPSATMSTLSIPSHSSAATFLDHPSVIHLWSSMIEQNIFTPYGWSMLIPYSSWEPHLPTGSFPRLMPKCVWPRQCPGAGWYFLKKASSTISKASEIWWKWKNHRIFL